MSSSKPDAAEPVEEDLQSNKNGQSCLEKPPSLREMDLLYELFLGRSIEGKDIYDVFWSRLSLKNCIKQIIESQEYTLASISKIIYSNKAVMFETRYGFVMPISLKEPLTLHSYLFNDYEREESDFIFSCLKKGDIAIDLGARHGWFTGIMAAAVGSDGRVYSFEPMPPFAGVRQLIEINELKNVVIIDAGAADVAGTLSFDGPTLTISNTGTQTIPLTTLDTIFSGNADNIKLIKADIEGAEPLAFKGGEELLRRCHPTLVFEVFRKKLLEVSQCTTTELIDWLRSCGYTKFRTLGGLDAGSSDFDAELTNLVATA